MSVQAVGSSTSAPTASQAATAAMKMDASTFMQMFTTQIANQDPMNPMNSADFLNQFAQMTSVETMTELQKTLSTVSSSIGSLTTNGKVSEATSLLGQTVTYTDANGVQQSGAVDSVRIKSDGSPLLIIGGTQVDLSAVTQVRTPTT